MFDLDRLVADCRAALGSPSAEAAIKEMLTAVVARPADIEAALGTPRVGGISTLHHSPELTILNVVWAPGMAIYPHDHRMWAIIGLYGGRDFSVERSEWTGDTREERPYDMAHARSAFAEANARWARESSA